ncbi:MAG: hypothetical protein HKN12_08870 [Gemmatimonadetes bacterium]|nr:hypothetical protein [Gemmatimonadota bacterium]
MIPLLLGAAAAAAVFTLSPAAAAAPVSSDPGSAVAAADSAGTLPDTTSASAPAPAPVPTPPVVQPVAKVVDVEARGRLFDHGIPVSDESFSPDGFNFSYLYPVAGGFLQRKPQRCTHLLDLGTGENRPVKTPKGTATRIGGWDPTGRYLLTEAIQPDFFAALTGGYTTYHWIFDVVTSEFVPRKPFTGRRDGVRFLWKQRGTYHGVWDNSVESTVMPLFEGELSDMYRAREEDLVREDERRAELAARIALGPDGPDRVLADVLPRLDARWTRRGQRDPVISELFGDRPGLWVLRDGTWWRACSEVDFVAILDHGLCLITASQGRQFVLSVDRWESVPLPDPPAEWIDILNKRWNRSEGFYDETDPLPRDLQYRRGYNTGQGTRSYFNYVVPDLSRLLTIYSLGPAQRTLRIVNLPESWRND